LKVLLVPLGSAGDVHPFFGLARALIERGHDATILCHGYFAGLAEREGLPFVEIGDAEEYLKVLNDPDLWHPTRSLALVMANFARAIQPTYDQLVNQIEPGQTVIVASTLAFGARLVAETHGVPLVSVALQPTMFRSVHEPPEYPGFKMPGWWPPTLKRFFFWFIDRAAIDPKIKPTLNAIRRELGLPPVSRVFHSWMFSPDRVLGLFPDWFAPIQPDWPERTALTGFPLYDEATVEHLPENVAAFLDEGPPPLVFTPGSAMKHGESFFATAVDVCRRLDRRGVLLSKFDEHIPKDLPSTVRHFQYVPFSRILPRCAALIHHGGIGTTAQALAAGTPQLIAAHAHDQYDNASRVARLGVGRGVPSHRLNGIEASAVLNELLNSNEVTARCRELASRIDGAAALDASCGLIVEAMGSLPRPGRSSTPSLRPAS
jgi:UDP:flavonoid glycosyltransferase YjiC (YdhE family)